MYDFRCETCGHEFEKNIRLDAPLPACPTCEGAVRKLISPISFQLKGSGWYKDHYGLKKPSGDGAGKSEGGSSGSSAAGGTKKAAGGDA